MKVIIAGPRDCTDMQAMVDAVCSSGFDITEVVSGGAKGVDAMAEQWARRCVIPVRRFTADWKKYGKAAGPIRNKEMADYADGLVALWKPESRGTWNMIEQATARGLNVFTYNLVLNGADA